MRMLRMLVDVVGLAQWTWGDREPPFVLEGGRHDLKISDEDVKCLQAIHDAADAKVGVNILAEGQEECEEFLFQEQAEALAATLATASEEDSAIEEVTDGSSS